MRVLLIGLDGATWTILKPLMAQGLMPALERFWQRSASGVLHSTLPPITPVAWASFQTGALAARHGIYGFQRVSRAPQGHLVFGMIDASALSIPTLWDHLGKGGKHVGIVNLPMTYPPKPVPGVLVTGFPTPSQRSSFTYPAQLKGELLKEVPNYRVPTLDFGYRVQQKRVPVPAYVTELVEMARARTEAALYLMRKYPWDLFVLQYQETDFLQHALWHHLDPHHPHFAAGEHRIVVRFYQELDGFIQRLVDTLTEEDFLWIISDHGFQGAQRVFYVNNWLCQGGWLPLNRGRGALAWQALEKLKRLDFFSLREKWFSPEARDRFRTAWMQAKFDWKSLRAYAMADHSGYFGIYVLRPGEAEVLREELLQLEDPKTGARVVRRVYPPEEAFGPDPQPGAPDLLVELIDGYSAAPEVTETEQGTLFTTRVPGEHFQIGIHHPEGIWLACGPGLRSGSRVDAQLIDIAPTLLSQMGLPVPASMDGVVLDSLFESASRREARAPQHYSIEKGQERGQGLTPEEEAQIQQQLRELGYLG